MTYTGYAPRTVSGRFANLLPEPDIESVFANAHPDSRLWMDAAAAAQRSLQRLIGKPAYDTWAEEAYPDDMTELTWRQIAEIAESALRTARQETSRG